MEPGIIMSLDNLNRAKAALNNVDDATARELRYAVRYYRAYNRNVKRQIKDAEATRDYYEREWGAGNWNDSKVSVLNSEKERNARKLRVLSGELRKRNNR